MIRSLYSSVNSSFDFWKLLGLNNNSGLNKPGNLILEIIALAIFSSSVLSNTIPNITFLWSLISPLTNSFNKWIISLDPILILLIFLWTTSESISPSSKIKAPDARLKSLNFLSVFNFLITLLTFLVIGAKPNADNALKTRNPKIPNTVDANNLLYQGYLSNSLKKSLAANPNSPSSLIDLNWAGVIRPYLLLYFSISSFLKPSFKNCITSFERYPSISFTSSGPNPSDSISTISFASNIDLYPLSNISWISRPAFSNAMNPLNLYLSKALRLLSLSSLILSGVIPSFMNSITSLPVA